MNAAASGVNFVTSGVNMAKSGYDTFNSGKDFVNALNNKNLKGKERTTVLMSHGSKTLTNAGNTLGNAAKFADAGGKLVTT